MPANLNPADPASHQFLKDHTIIFDFSNLPPDAEELAARHAIRQLRHAMRNRRRPGPSSTPPPPSRQLVIPEPGSGSEGREGYTENLPRNRGGQPGNNNAIKVGFRELCAPEEPEPGSGSEDREGYTENLPRNRGGQPGNNNALKYGFYSRRLPSRELEGLDQTAVSSLKDEIDVMRVFSRKVAELGSDIDDLSDAKDLLRVLSLATTSINRLVRTHTRIPDPDLDPAQLLKTALLELEDEWPELKAFAAQFHDKPSPDHPPSQEQS